MTVIEQIEEKLPFLTRKQREVANYMLEDPERMSYVTLKEMSRDTDITEMTILKTCTLLGFSSFSNMKYEFRKYAAMQLEQFRSQNSGNQISAVSQSERDDDGRLLREICQEEAKIAVAYLEQLDPTTIFHVADLILAADKILLFGRGVSTCICHYAASLFSSIGKGTVAVNTELYDDVYGVLPLLDEKTLVIVVAFPDYYLTTVKVAETAQKQGAKVLAITDNERSPICEFSDFNLFCPTQNRVFLNNISMPMELINLLATAMNLRLSPEQKDRTFADPCNRYSDMNL